MNYPPRYIFFMCLLFVGAHSSLIYAQTQKDSQRNNQTEVRSENESLKNLSEKSEIIMIGKVTKQKSSWNENKSRIFTDVTLQVDEYLKGQNNGRTIVVRHPGGEVDNVGELYTHMPVFSNDEQVLLFVKKDLRSNEYNVMDGDKGKISITNDTKLNDRPSVNVRKVNKLKEEIKSYLDLKSDSK